MAERSISPVPPCATATDAAAWSCDKEGEMLESNIITAANSFLRNVFPFMMVKGMVLFGFIS